MTNLTSLIARLEQAESGSRELDCRISASIDGGEFDDLWLESEGKMQPNWALTIPPYTTSLDAALTLVPEGWRITHAYGPPWAWCLTKTAPEEDGSRRYAEGKSATPALALAIASLKARSRVEGK